MGTHLESLIYGRYTSYIIIIIVIVIVTVTITITIIIIIIIIIIKITHEPNFFHSPTLAFCCWYSQNRFTDFTDIFTV